MNQEPLLFAIFVIFTGAAVLSTIVLATRQSVLVAYIILGGILGPWGLGFIADPTLVNHIGEVGILFLLFLIGLQLDPRDLVHTIRKVTLVTVISSVVFFVIGYELAYLFGFTKFEAFIVGITMMFSSTIVALKLLPNVMLHHQHIGEVMTGILLLQDMIAIFMLLLIHAMQTGTGLGWDDALQAVLALPFLVIFAYFLHRFVLVKLFIHFSHIKEYVFLLALGWCLGMAQLGNIIGLSAGVGAFIAGVAIAASSPIALYIAESLRPLRDFFLVLFFFSIGADFNFHYLPEVIYPALILAAISLFVKPAVFSLLLRWRGEKKLQAWEIGFRLGQASEFSLLVGFLATQSVPALIGPKAEYLIQSMTVFTFIVSCYLVSWRYETPSTAESQIAHH